MSNYVRNRNRRTSRTRRDEYNEGDRKWELITEIKEKMKNARDIIQDTELFPGLTGDGGILLFTREEMDILRRESERIRVNQKNTNFGLVLGSSLGVISGGVAIAGIMASVGTLVAATGGVAAVIGGVSSVAAAISRSCSESYTRRQIQSIVEKLNRLPDVMFAMLTVSDLAPGEFGIENVLEDRQTNLTVESLLEIKRKTNELVNVLSGMKKAVDKNNGLNSMLEILGKASLLVDTIGTILDRNEIATVATVVATTRWLLTQYRGTSQNYRNALQMIEKFMIASPTIINLLAKSSMLSANWSGLVKIVSSSQVIRVAQKGAEKILEKTGTNLSSKACAEVAEKGTNVICPAGTVVAGKVGGEALEQVRTKVAGTVGGEIVEQASTKVVGKVGGEVLEQGGNTVAQKFGGEVAEQAANSSNVSGIVSSAASVKYIRIICASVVITGILIDGITLKSALQNLYNGSSTGLSNFLSSLADVLEPLGLV